MNVFNYQYNKLDLLLSRLDTLIDNTNSLEEKGKKTEITIIKSKYGYWNLKLKIYDEGKSTEEISTFHQRVKENGTS